MTSIWPPADSPVVTLTVSVRPFVVPVEGNGHRRLAVARCDTALTGTVRTSSLTVEEIAPVIEVPMLNEASSVLKLDRDGILRNPGRRIGDLADLGHGARCGGSGAPFVRVRRCRSRCRCRCRRPGSAVPPPNCRKGRTRPEPLEDPVDTDTVTDAPTVDAVDLTAVDLRARRSSGPLLTTWMSGVDEVVSPLVLPLAEGIRTG